MSIHKTRIVAIFVFTCFLLPPTFGTAIEVCDNGVNFDHGATYKSFTGTVTCQDKDSGKRTQKVTLKNGKKNGIRLIYGYGSDNIWREENYVNDIKDGQEKTWNYKENYLQSTVVYKNGRPVGVGKYFYKNGGLKSIRWAGADRNRDTIVQYLEDGRLSLIQCGEHSVSKEEAELCGRNGTLSDLTLYDPRGRKKETRHYLDAKANGTWIRYGANGQITLKTNYKDNVLEGESTAYWNNGQVGKVEAFKKGLKVSKIEYYQNGKPKVKELYKREEKLIEAAEYYDNGNKRLEGTFRPKRDDWWYYSWNYWQPVGTLKSYDEDGRLESEAIYKDGYLAKKKIYDKNGKLEKEEEYHPDGSRK